MTVLWALLSFLSSQVFSTQSGDAIQPSTYTAPGAFPTSVYSKYFNSPTQTSAQVQPGDQFPIVRTLYTLLTFSFLFQVISDPVTVSFHRSRWMHSSDSFGPCSIKPTTTCWPILTLCPRRVFLYKMLTIEKADIVPLVTRKTQKIPILYLPRRRHHSSFNMLSVRFCLLRQIQPLGKTLAQSVWRLWKLPNF